MKNLDLANAIDEGDLETFQRILSEWGSDCINGQQLTRACFHGRVDMTKTLLKDRRCDVFCDKTPTTYYKQDPYEHYRVRHTDLFANTQIGIRYLPQTLCSRYDICIVHVGARPIPRCKYNSPLAAAVQGGSLGCLMLLDRDARFNIHQNQNILYEIALECGNLDTLKYLMKRGVFSPSNCLFSAVFKERAGLVETIIDGRFSEGAIDAELLHAIIIGSLDMVEILLPRVEKHVLLKHVDSAKPYPAIYNLLQTQIAFIE